MPSMFELGWNEELFLSGEDHLGIVTHAWDIPFSIVGPKIELSGETHKRE